MQLLPDGERLESNGALADGFTPEDVNGWLQPALAGCATVVCGGVWRDDFPPATLARLAGGGRRIFFDGQGYARPARCGPLQLEGPLDPGDVRGVTVMKLSEEEADVLIGGPDPVAAKLSGVPIVVVTQGSRGALLLHEGRVKHVPVRPVQVTDSIGCGDAFLALMAAAMDAGLGPEAAVAAGCNGVSRMLHAAVMGVPV
jgi:sugar/nucleoside kinase (ribokinase family)